MAPRAQGLCLGPSWSGCPSHGNEKWEITGFSVLECWGVPRAATQTLVMGVRCWLAKHQGAAKSWGWGRNSRRSLLGQGAEENSVSSDGASLGSVWVWLRPPSARLPGLGCPLHGPKMWTLCSQPLWVPVPSQMSNTVWVRPYLPQPSLKAACSSSLGPRSLSAPA